MKNINIHVLAGNPALLPKEQMIAKEVREAVRVIAKFIPIANVDITIGHRPEKIGSAGAGKISVQVENRHMVNIALDLKHKHLKKNFHSDLLEALAYALYFVVRTQKIGYAKNLLEECVQEGLAFNFQSEVSGDKSEPYFMAIKNIKKIKSVVVRAKKEFFSIHYSHDDWFGGSKERNIPRFAGYIIGYVMIKHFLKVNPRFTLSQLVGKKASDFIPKK